MCKQSTHEVKTLDKAREWYPEVAEGQLPIHVEQMTASNGRVRVVVSSDGVVVHSRG